MKKRIQWEKLDKETDLFAKEKEIRKRWRKKIFGKMPSGILRRLQNISFW